MRIARVRDRRVRALSLWTGSIAIEGAVRPSPIEPDEFGTVRAQDLRSQVAFRCSFREHHHDESPRSRIVDVSPQMSVFLGWTRRADQGALETREEPVVRTGGIEALQSCFDMQNVDFVPCETRPQ